MQQPNEISIFINGESIDVLETTSLQSLVSLEVGGLDTPIICAVNDSIVAKSLYSKTLLQEGDRVEILSPVAGG